MASLLAPALALTEKGLLPDFLIRWGIRRLLRRRLEEIGGGDPAARLEAFAASMREGPVAPVPEKANEQHYEVPAAFFEHVLGPRLKYSCLFYPEGVESIEDAELASLGLTVDRADLRDGMDILELGCGWGSLSLFMAERFPNSRVTAVSNSASQREFIQARAGERGLGNLTVITADMNDFAPEGTFDRVVSVEMFEHMRNYEELLRRISGWLRPGAKLFVHVFCHRDRAYEFRTEGESDWMGRYFFTGGIMPTPDLFRRFDRHLAVERQWTIDGTHYARTSEAWLDRMDAAKDDLLPVLAGTYGEGEAARWFQRWRVFFLSCAELFGFAGGSEWFVCHTLLAPPGVN